MFAPKMNEEDYRRVAKENEKKIDPYDEVAIRKIACAVILEVVKTWHEPGPNTTARNFFLSDDYVFWACLAGIGMEGEDVIKALEKNGGCSRKFFRGID